MSWPACCIYAAAQALSYMFVSNEGGKIVIMSCRHDCQFAELVCRPDHDTVMGSCASLH